MFNNQQPSRNQDLNEILQRAKMQNQGLARDDITKALKTFNNQVCCSLAGTIPVRYKGNTYNIPVLSTFWTTIPTLVLSAMSDQQLPCGFEYWRYPGYETSGLLQIDMAFQDKCPVYSVSSSHANPVPNPTTPYPMAASGVLLRIPPPIPVPTYQLLTHFRCFWVCISRSLSNSWSNDLPAAYQPYMNLPNAVLALLSIPTSLQMYLSNKSRMLAMPPVGMLMEQHHNNPKSLRDKIGTPFAELQSVNINPRATNRQQKLKGMLERIDQEQKQLDIILSPISRTVLAAFRYNLSIPPTKSRFRLDQQGTNYLLLIGCSHHRHT
uniref:Uncharacterized protein n=1 Tax=Ditylenchus dipsaci TaxID=166011 RepID=A0A915DZG7_9BILA